MWSCGEFAPVRWQRWYSGERYPTGKSAKGRGAARSRCLLDASDTAARCSQGAPCDSLIFVTAGTLSVVQHIEFTAAIPLHAHVPIRPFYPILCDLIRSYPILSDLIRSYPIRSLISDLGPVTPPRVRHCAACFQRATCNMARTALTAQCTCTNPHNAPLQQHAARSAHSHRWARLCDSALRLQPRRRTKLTTAGGLFRLRTLGACGPLSRLSVLCSHRLCSASRTARLDA